ncbi:MAG: hypothetical protein RLZ71_719 [Actinomycetota bacterium]|jgi:hypothetical protein
MESDKAQIYKLISDRRTHWDNLQWQIPSLTLSGEAFLFSVAFDVQKQEPARIITALVAAIVAVACILTMSRFRVNEIEDSEMLERLEAELGLEPLHGRAFSARRNAFLERKSRVKPTLREDDVIAWDCFFDCEVQISESSHKAVRRLAETHLKDYHSKEWMKPRKRDLALNFLNRHLKAFDVWIVIFCIFVAMSAVAILLATKVW